VQTVARYGEMISRRAGTSQTRFANKAVEPARSFSSGDPAGAGEWPARVSQRTRSQPAAHCTPRAAATSNAAAIPSSQKWLAVTTTTSVVRAG
jgi:hypothetical protein